MCQLFEYLPFIMVTNSNPSQYYQRNNPQINRTGIFNTLAVLSHSFNVTLHCHDFNANPNMASVKNFKMVRLIACNV